MASLPELELNYTKFLDKTTILYGETNTGKSTIIVDILYQLRSHVDQIMVISPSDRSNHTYDRGIVPLPCIHYTITPKLLEDIWERQSALTAIHAKANKPEIIKSLFKKIPNNGGTRDILARLHHKRKMISRELSDRGAGSKIAEINKNYNAMVMLLYKQSINKHKSRLDIGDDKLSPDETFTLKFLNLNPRLVLIFDDCTDMIRRYSKHPIIQRLFYQGRHAQITALIACHTDKALDAELRKNAFVSIFTEECSAHAYFTRPSNDLDKDAKIRAASACKCSFTPLAEYQKLAWIREEKKFYRYTASKRDGFKFGCRIIWEYCKSIQARAGTLDPTNKFIHDFAQ